MSRPPKETRIVIVDDRIFKSIVSDLCTFLSLAGIIGLGWFLGSDAMQWCGFILTVVFLAAMASGRENRLTVSQARKRLDEIEGRA